MASRVPRAPLTALVAAALASCDVPRPVAYGRLTDGCNTCHGNADNAAPPTSTKGLTATTDLAVGAHQSHLRDGSLRNAIECSECHIVPATPSSSGHLNGVVEVFVAGAGQLARAGGAMPSWNADGTCSGVYCHGAVLGAGGTNHQPIWTNVDGTQAACGTCHGLPPPVSQGHPSVTGGLAACAACHPGTVKSDGTIDVAGGKHVNGVVDVAAAHLSGWSDPTAHGYGANRQGLAYCQSCHGVDFDGGSSGISCNACHGGSAWQTNCTFCHGDPARTATAIDPQLPAAPPVGTQGQEAASTIAVGAHQPHLAAGAAANAFACTECHPVPTDLSHVDGKPPAMAWGSLAKANGAIPTWDRTTTQSCSNYCHGQTLTSSGGSNTMPVWTSVDGTQAACDTCHATAQIQTGKHPVHIVVQGFSCSACHSNYTATSINPAIHVNGTRDVGGAGTSITSYNASTQSCTPACHPSRTW